MRATMWSKHKIPKCRTSQNDNVANVKNEADKANDDNKVGKKVGGPGDGQQNANLNDKEVEDFLLSEYFAKDEFSGMSCWDICSLYNTHQRLSNLDDKSEIHDTNSPITALALMFLSQYSSLPRPIKKR